MRQQTEAEKAVGFSLAIYKGLPDNERAAKLAEWRTMPGYNARTLVVLCEQYEMHVRLERERLSALEKEVQFVRQQLARTAGQTYGQPDMYGHERAEIQRAAFGIGLVVAGVGAACWLFFQVGPYVVFGSLAALGLLGLMCGGSSGKPKDDYVPATGQAQGGQSININITGHGGQINFSQGQGQ